MNTWRTLGFFTTTPLPVVLATCQQVYVACRALQANVQRGQKTKSSRAAQGGAKPRVGGKR